MAQLAREDVPRLKLKWAFGFPGANFAFAQPTVMGGRVFVGSQGGIFARRKHRLYLLGIRCRSAGAFGDHHWT